MAEYLEKTRAWLESHPRQRVVVPVLLRGASFGYSADPMTSNYATVEYWWEYPNKVWTHCDGIYRHSTIQPSATDEIIEAVIDSMVKHAAAGDFDKNPEPQPTGVTLDELFEQDTDD